MDTVEVKTRSSRRLSVAAVRTTRYEQKRRGLKDRQGQMDQHDTAYANAEEIVANGGEISKIKSFSIWSMTRLTHEKTPRISIRNQKTTPHPMVSLATKPNQPLHRWRRSNEYRVSPIRKKEKPMYRKEKSRKPEVKDNAWCKNLTKNRTNRMKTNLRYFNSPSNADVYRFRL